jgi:Concanavalin A-like lectin/glucanases superfamily/Bacterial Ig-like domain
MVVVTFNQMLQGSSVNDTNVTVTAGGSPVAIVVALGSGGDAIEVTPQAGTWAQATMHTVTIGTGVTSMSSASLASPYSFSFTTLDNAALRGRWVFNNSSVDVSGNGPAATVTGGTYDSVSLHEGSHSLALNSGSVVDLGTFDLGNQFSYTAWVNVTSTSSILTLFANGVAGFSTDGIKVFVNEWGTSNRRIVIESGNGSAGKQIWTDQNFVTFGAWFHVAVTIDRTLGEAYLYFNGEQADTYDSGSSLASNLIRDDFGNNQQLYLNQFPGGNFHFVGNQDDVRFYNRVLTANEIRNIANEN